jgi:hypothetical protein
MANELYDKGKERILGGEIDLSVDTAATIKVALVNTTSGTGAADGYDYVSTHEYLENITSDGSATGTDRVVGTPVELTSLLTTDGVFTAAATTFTALSASLDSFEALVIYREVNDATDSPLIAFIDVGGGLDSASAEGTTPNGGDVEIIWPIASAGGIFSI